MGQQAGQVARSAGSGLQTLGGSLADVAREGGETVRAVTMIPLYLAALGAVLLIGWVYFNYRKGAAVAGAVGG